MKIDFRSQRIVSELDNFYNTRGKLHEEHGYYKVSKTSVSKHFLLVETYNLLKEEGTLPDYPPNIKQELWGLAQQSILLNKDKKERINDYYKSYLVVRFLVDRLPERMFIYDESGKRITRIELK